MLIDLAKCQANLGHNVSIIVTNNSYEQALIDNIDSRIHVQLIHRPEGSKNPLYVLYLFKAIKKQRPNVIHFHNDSAAKISCLFKNVVCVGTVHCPGINIRYYTKLDKIYAISQAVADDLETRQNIRSKIINNGINFDIIKSNPAPYTPPEPFRIVQIGRMRCNIKGQDIMIKATAILIQKGYNVSVDLIGETNDGAILRELSAKLSITDYVHIIGLKSRQYIYDNLCTYHLGVLPSLYEGFGLSIVEYMAAKIPVVATDVDGPAEIIQDNRYGLLCKPGDPEDLARAIAEIINNYDKFSICAHNNVYKYAYNNFGIQTTALNYLKNYEALIINKKT